MASFNLRQVHVFERQPGTRTDVLKYTNPAMRLRSGDEEVWIQHGQYWTSSGQKIKPSNLPSWVAEELKKCNPVALAECGIEIKVDIKA